MVSDAVVAESLVKRYGEVLAINGVSFRVKRGEICGLLGPNGAGKTTTIGILSTIIKPTSGKAFVCGFDVVKEKNEVRKRIALVPQEIALDYLLSVYDNLYFYGWLQGIPRGELRERIELVMRKLGLEEVKKVPVIRLSGGLMRRVQLARLFLSNPEVAFLDEPTLAMDPVARIKAWRMIKDFVKRHGITVVLATNDMREAEVLCDRIVFINRGRVVAEGTPEELRRICGERVVEVIVEDGVFIDKVRGANRVIVDGGKLRIYTRNVAEALQDVVSKLGPRVIKDIKVLEPSLEDVFARIVREG